MTQILAITFPIYGAIALGYLVVAKGWFGQAEMRTLGKYVINIALPALLFNAVASRRIADVFQPDYMLAYGLGGLATIAAAWILFSLRGTDPQRRALGVMGSTCPNNAFIGFPIMLLAFPAEAEVILALNLLVEKHPAGAALPDADGKCVGQTTGVPAAPGREHPAERPENADDHRAAAGFGHLAFRAGAARPIHPADRNVGGLGLGPVRWW